MSDAIMWRRALLTGFGLAARVPQEPREARGRHCARSCKALCTGVWRYTQLGCFRRGFSGL